MLSLLLLLLPAAKEVSDKVKAAAAARAAAMAAADEAPALSETAVATAQRDIAALLQPGESVTAGLRRLGQARRGAAPGKGEQLRHLAKCGHSGCHLECRA
jgi:hypothetical protein